jgi:hypothetical protein
MEELRNVNHLNYELPICPDVVADSKTSIFNFNPNSYENTLGGDVMQVEFAEGVDYIDPQASFIRLKLSVRNPLIVNKDVERYGFASVEGRAQSVMNLISTVELVTKDGQTLFKELHKNEMQTIRDYKNNISRMNYLTMLGMSPVEAWRVRPPFFISKNNTTFYIPLSEISPFFNGQYIPYKLISGAILRLTLAKVSNSVFTFTQFEGNLVRNDNPNTTATISNMALILAEKELYPDIKEKINKQINSPQGLEYVYYTNYNTNYTFNDSADPNSFSIPIDLSAGKIKYIAIKPIPANRTIGYQSATWGDFFGGGVNDNKYNLPFKIKIRLGNDVLSTYDVTTIPEMYEQTVATLNNQSFASCEDIDVERCINKKSPCSVSGQIYAETRRGSPPTVISFPSLIFAFDFERLQCLGVSGLSTNSERVLTVEISDFITSRNVNEFYFSIQYLVCANVFSDGAIAVNK